MPDKKPVRPSDLLFASLFWVIMGSCAAAWVALGLTLSLLFGR